MAAGVRCSSDGRLGVVGVIAHDKRHRRSASPPHRTRPGLSGFSFPFWSRCPSHTGVDCALDGVLHLHLVQHVAEHRAFHVQLGIRVNWLHVMLGNKPRLAVGHPALKRTLFPLRPTLRRLRGILGVLGGEEPAPVPWRLEVSP
jgi:hypothetical protein